MSTRRRTRATHEFTLSCAISLTRPVSGAFYFGPSLTTLRTLEEAEG